MKINLFGWIILLSASQAQSGNFEELFPKITHDKHLEQAQEEFKRFAEHYRPPQNICDKIHKHESDLWKYDQENDDYTWHHEKTPEIYFKQGNRDNFMRIINSDILRKIIVDHNISCIKVPQKWVYPIKNKWFVVAEYIPDSLNEPKKLEVNHVRALIKFFAKTGYNDMWPDNIKFIENDDLTIVFIDTEDKSFTPNKSKIEYVENIEHFENRMTPAAKEWIEKYIEKLKQDPENTIPYDPTPKSTRISKAEFDYTALARYGSFLEKKKHT